MKVLLTQTQEITSKKGDKYVILRGISSDGGTVEAFLNAAQAQEFKAAELPKLTKEEVTEIQNGFKCVEMDFDQRGRLVEVSAD